MPKHVVIVGGGLSGLAAGVALARRGIRVTILEQKPALGGRAYSFKDTVTGDTIDNGQHVLIAGYEHAMHFLKTIGTRDHLRVQKSLSLHFHHPERGFHEFRLPLIAAPWNMLAGVLGCSLFSPSDQWRLLRAGFLVRTLGASAEKHLASVTIEQWLHEAGQSIECVRSFWQPIAVSMMNETISKASALVFIRALREAFLGGSRNAALAIPAVGLSELYVNGAKNFVLLHGGEIRCNADVVGVTVENNLAVSVTLKDVAAVKGNAVILAVPPNKLVPILPVGLKQELSFLETFDFAPIVSLHLWFTEEFMEHEFVGLIGRRIQWLFNKRRISNERGRGAHVSAVISGAHDFVEKSKTELVRIALDDIRGVYPILKGEPSHAVVIREKFATYSSNPRIEALRPSNRTGIANLFIAGDWTATEYPATIEGAILSAELATNGAMEYFG